MFRLALAVFGMIVLPMIGGAYFGFSPAWPILAILGFGIFMVGRIGGPALPSGGRRTPWGGGHGIYFDSGDIRGNGPDFERSGAAQDARDARERG